jgi:hypothetical protein
MRIVPEAEIDDSRAHQISRESTPQSRESMAVVIAPVRKIHDIDRRPFTSAAMRVSHAGADAESCSPLLLYERRTSKNRCGSSDPYARRACAPLQQIAACAPQPAGRPDA